MKILLEWEIGPHPPWIGLAQSRLHHFKVPIHNKVCYSSRVFGRTVQDRNHSPHSILRQMCLLWAGDSEWSIHSLALHLVSLYTFTMQNTSRASRSWIIVAGEERGKAVPGKTVTLITVFQGTGESYYKGLTKRYWRERERIGRQSQVKVAWESGIRGGPREMLNSYEGWGRCSQRWGRANGKARGNCATEIIDRQSTDAMKYLEMPQTNIFRWKNRYARKEPSKPEVKHTHEYG